MNAFGAFADAETYLASVAAHAYVGPDGELESWVPTPLAREVELRFLLDQVDDADDRASLEAALGDTVLAGDRPSPDPALRDSLRTEPARTVHDLLTSASLAEATRAISDLPDASLAFVDAISPVRHLAGLHASVYLMHETEDHHVPYVETRALAEALEPPVGWCGTPSSGSSTTSSPTTWTSWRPPPSCGSSCSTCGS